MTRRYHHEPARRGLWIGGNQASGDSARGCTVRATPARAAFTSLFRDTLECEVIERDFGLQYPVALVSFSDGSRFSAEFTDLAPVGTPGDAVSDDQSFRGAWLEFRTTDLAGDQQKLRSAGIPESRHAGSTHAYFVAPGDQMFRLVDVDYEGP